MPTFTLTEQQAAAARCAIKRQLRKSDESSPTFGDKNLAWALIALTPAEPTAPHIYAKAQRIAA